MQTLQINKECQIESGGVEGVCVCLRETERPYKARESESLLITFSSALRDSFRKALKQLRERLCIFHPAS